MFSRRAISACVADPSSRRNASHADRAQDRALRLVRKAAFAG
ncbi:hypothetical protein [Caudoviricetes sp.]|nr:hypothetical protein [Caudoviricetes sp.]UOF82771.1 hypothetical protein [Caudoviricetes sp.]